MGHSKFDIEDWGLGIGEYAGIDWNRPEWTRILQNRLKYAGICGNRPIQAYSSLFLPTPTYSCPFKSIPAHSSLFQSIPAQFSLFLPILPYSSIFQPNPVYAILFQPIFQSPFSNPQSPISNLECPIVHFILNCAFVCQFYILSKLSELDLHTLHKETLQACASISVPKLCNFHLQYLVNFVKN